MIIAFDIETRGLNSQNFILGCIATDTGIMKTFWKKEDLWAYLLKLGETCAKQHKNVTCYAHNLAYDLYGVIDWNAAGISIFSTEPLIVDYKNIKFIDSTGLYSGKLEDLGKLIGEHKGQTPTWLYDPKYEPTEEELNEAARYCMQDCLVLLNGIKRLKERLRADGINVRTLITIGQCAINGYLTFLQHLENPKTYFDTGTDDNGVPNWAVRKFPITKNEDKVRAAFKGARTEVFANGDHVACMADVNSMYPWAMTTIRYPDLRSEQLHEKPTLEEFRYSRNIKRDIGVAKAHVTAGPKDTVGTLAVREEKGLAFLTTGQHAIGTWTYEELSAFEERGGTIHHIFWYITWRELATNPLRVYIETLYQRRVESKTPYDKWFYKQLMNHLFGKFAQHRPQITYELGHIDETEERLSQGWEIQIATSSTHNLYRKKTENPERKKFYAPILSALITARARLRLLEILETVPREQLLYCDTDSIMWAGTADAFKYSDTLGGLKLVHQDALATIVKKKSYSIAGERHASGIPREALGARTFLGQPTSYQRMVTPFETTDISAVGTFITIERSIEEHNEEQEKDSFLIDFNELTSDTLAYLKSLEAS